jgi:7-cyano-7-deazaguanine synthase in queuosine biosynthesis
MRIEIPEDCEKIHVLFSGGMDSSILLYLLAKQMVEEEKSVSLITHSFGNSYRSKHVPTVINFIENKFSYPIKIRKHQLSYNIRDIVNLILTTEGGCVFSGCNKVIENQFKPKRYIPGDTPPWRGPPHSDHHLRPFIELDKIEILNIYVTENILELLPLTHSCGTTSREKCGECYFCLERKWATDALNISDI